jgi:NADPH-ferrihemoprotein reductase
LYFRKEELWPALDQLLRDEDDTTVATPYTASVSEYRVVIHDSLDVTIDEKKRQNGNGIAVVDAQHPVRCSIAVYFWQLGYTKL